MGTQLWKLGYIFKKLGHNFRKAGYILEKTRIHFVRPVVNLFLNFWSFSETETQFQDPRIHFQETRIHVWETRTQFQETMIQFRATGIHFRETSGDPFLEFLVICGLKFHIRQHGESYNMPKS